MGLLQRVRHGVASSAPPAKEVRFTGSCPVREHAGDGGYIGRCEFATYEGYCPRHGDVREFVLEENRDLSGADDRQLPAPGQRDFGPPAVRAKLGRD